MLALCAFHSAASMRRRKIADISTRLVHQVYDEVKPGENKMDRAFEVHKLNSKGMAKAERLAHVFDTNLSLMREICGVPDHGLESILFSRAVEHLELASFYAKKEIAQHPENQILNDVTLPSATGFETMTETRGAQEGTLATPPYLALTNFSTSELEVELKRRSLRKK
jgi:hypothetical protein